MTDYIGKPIPIYDAVAKVSGEAAYTDDLAFPNPLWGMILPSPHAHAKILSIDAAEALALPGVHTVITYEDAPETVYCRNMRRIHDPGPATERVFNRIVRYAGDKVAAVAAESEEICRKALRLIRVEYEVLPAVFNPVDALKPGAPKVYPEGNLVKESVVGCGDVDQALKEANIVIEQTIETSMLHHAAIEPHICVAYWSREDELSVWEPQRAPFRMQIMLSKIFNMPYSKVHVHGQVIGGTFGSKEGVMLEPVALLLSKKTGRYIKIRFSRKECITSTFTRHSMHMTGRMGIDETGRITALNMTGIMQVGAYCGDSLTVLVGMTGKFFKLYSIPSMRFHGLPAYTNTPLGGAMRGYGSPNIFAAVEILADQAARKIGMDPVEFRLKNLVDPWDTDPVNGQSLGNARVKDCLLRGAAQFRWKEQLEECAVLSDDRYAYGCGCATTLHGNGIAPGATDITVVSMELHEDGSVLLRTGVTDHGAGTYTLYRQIVASVLQMPMEHVELTFSDTYQGHFDKGAGSSRNTWVSGTAVKQVTELILEDMLEVAATAMSLPVGEVKFQNGVFVSRDDTKTLTKIDIAEYACEIQRKKLIRALSYNSPKNAGSYGAHFTSVRVDKKTGEVKVLDYVAVSDVGRALNPMLLEGQIEGGILMGMGMALYEQIELDDKGVVRNASFKGYRIGKMSDMPNMKILFVEEGEEGGPYGAKSIGEASLVPVAPAIVNAVNRALGTSLSHLPLTPDKILAAIHEKEVNS